jgi:hypothetical protein
LSKVKLVNFPYFSTKKLKNPLFQIIFSKFQCSPFGLQIPFFCSKTSLYILKLIVRMKKKSKKNYGTLLTTASNHCGLVCWIYPHPFRFKWWKRQNLFWELISAHLTKAGGQLIFSLSIVFLLSRTTCK